MNFTLFFAFKKLAPKPPRRSIPGAQPSAPKTAVPEWGSIERQPISAVIGLGHAFYGIGRYNVDTYRYSPASAPS